MKQWIGVLAVMAMFSALALGQATPISSTPDQPQSTAATAQERTPTRKAKVHHTRAHHNRHKKHHKAA